MEFWFHMFISQDQVEKKTALLYLWIFFHYKWHFDLTLLHILCYIPYSKDCIADAILLCNGK